MHLYLYITRAISDLIPVMKQIKYYATINIVVMKTFPNFYVISYFSRYILDCILYIVTAPRHHTSIQHYVIITLSDTHYYTH